VDDQGQDDGRFVVVATTRPETLFGDMAVAVNPKDKRYSKLVGCRVRLPFVNRLIPIIADDHADPEKQTGVVKITPAHDFNDFEVGRRHGLDMPTIMDIHGCLVDSLPAPFGGMERFKARAQVIEALEAMGQLEKIDEVNHAIPYGERSAVVLEPRLTDQWFVNTSDLAARALAVVEQGTTQFVPENYIATYRHWMTNIQPWCISRQLWWGHRIPAWYGPDGHSFVSMTEADAQAQALAYYGKSEALIQDEDVLDTWFSSALWPFSTLGWPEETADLKAFYPTSVLVTGTDILFFWVARMMMMGLYALGDVPFKTVLLHALVRDEKGQKMSKTKGNVVDPLEVMDEYGADALRFTMAALASPGRDLRFSKRVVEIYRNFGTKIWNATRFCVGHGIALGTQDTPPAVTHPIHQWIQHETAQVLNLLEEKMAAYRFDEAASVLYQFVWGTVCDWYIELCKPLLEGEDQAQRLEAQQSLGWLLGIICRILHPFMPHMTEEIWQQLAPGSGLLMQASWPLMGAEARTQLQAPQAHNAVSFLVRLISRIRAVRTEINIPASAHIDLIIKNEDRDLKATLTQFESALFKLARLKSLTFSNQAPATGVAQCVVDDLLVLIPLGDVIDLDAERTRLSKALKKSQQEAEGLLKKLSNEAFCQNAPQDILQKNRDRLAEEQAQQAKLLEALSYLGGEENAARA
jgi:valyl-tRNA synthetase